MPSALSENEIRQKATSVEESFRVKDGLYIIGSLEKGVTVYKQQVRAHNLAWALWELAGKDNDPPQIAVVGGGIAGLTVSACLLSLFPKSCVTVFERYWDLCPLQQGSDHRWLHPRIYDWPAVESRRPHAALPVLDWSEGRASDVTRKIISGFARVAKELDPEKTRLQAFVGLEDLKISASNGEIDWKGHKAERNENSFFRITVPERNSATFNIIVLACGFGLESQVPEFPLASYWRNEQIGQPLLDGTHPTFVVSGYGDGALVDLFRLRIERFRQDTILDEIFADKLENVESHFWEVWPPTRWNENVFSAFAKYWDEWLAEPAERLSQRLRKDTHVILHIKGKSNDITSFEQIFGGSSSFLSRLLTYLLYRCNAFEITFDDLNSTILHHKVSTENVICRHGADALGHLRGIFEDFDLIGDRLNELKASLPQTPRPLWQPGAFPYIPNR